MAKSGAARDYEHRTHRWKRTYKRSAKILLVKIKKLLWAQYVRARDSITKSLVEV